LRSSSKRGVWFVIGFLAVFLTVLFTLFAMAPAELPIAQDTSRDLVLAAQCLESDTCRLIGASTSFSELHQGGPWMLHLSLLRGIGADLLGIRTISLIVAALSFALLAFAGECLFSPGTGLLAAALCLLFAGLTGQFLPQWNPSLIVFPSVLFYFAALIAARSRSPFFYLVSALAAAVMVQLHPVGLLMLPFLLVLFLLFRPRRWPAVLAVGLALFVVSVLSMSWHAAGYAVDAFSLRHLTSGTGMGGEVEPVMQGYLGWVALFGPLFWLVSTGSRHKDDIPRSALLLLTVGPVLLFYGLSLLANRPVVHRYMLVCIPGLALLAAASTASLMKRGLGWLRRAQTLRLAAEISPRTVAALLFALVVLHCLVSLVRWEPHHHTVYTFRDAEVAAEELPRFSINSYADAVERMTAPAQFYLLSGLQVFMSEATPPGPPRPNKKRGRFVVVLKSDVPPPAGIPDDWVVVRTDVASWLYLVQRDLALDWSALRMRYELKSEPVLGEDFAPVRLTASTIQEEPGFPHYSGTPGEQEWDTLKAIVPLVVNTNSPLILVPYVHRTQSGNSAEIVRIENLRHCITDNGGRAVVAAGQAGRAGTVEFVWRFEQPNPFMGMAPPFVFEIPADDGAYWKLMETIR